MPQGRSRPSPLILRARRLLPNDQIILTLLAVMIGTLAGSMALLFIEKIDLFQTFLLGVSGDAIAAHIAGLAPWRVMVVPTVGGLLVGYFMHRFMSDQRPKGPVDVIQAVEVGEGRLPVKDGAVAMISSALSIGAGASVGREGPAVHLGATVGAFVADKLKLSRSNVRVLLACGVAAAVSASFNAPIAGALFAQEVILSHYALKAFAPVVIASISGTVLAHQIVGNETEFQLSGFQLATYLEFPAFGTLGLVCGFIAVAFTLSILKTQAKTQNLPGPIWVRPAYGGFLVGLIALFYPEVLGVGYDATKNALQGNYGFDLLIGILIFKFLATVLSLGFGFAGGVFSPSLVIGAMMGGAFGMIMASFFPEMSSGTAAYALIGMAAVAAAVLGAPISTTLIIFELTGDYGLSIAVMMACVLSVLVTHQLGRESFFMEQLKDRGVDIKGNHRNLMLRNIQVHDVVQTSGPYVRLDAPLHQVRDHMKSATGTTVYVLNLDRSLYGVIRLSDLPEEVFDTSLDPLVRALDIADPNAVFLEDCETLETAQAVFDDAQIFQIPVVEHAGQRAFIGVLEERDLVLAYHRELVQSRQAEQGQS